jgi:hypothetical protein
MPNRKNVSKEERLYRRTLQHRERQPSSVEDAYFARTLPSWFPLSLPALTRMIREPTVCRSFAKKAGYFRSNEKARDEERKISPLFRCLSIAVLLV